MEQRFQMTKKIQFIFVSKDDKFNLSVDETDKFHSQNPSVEFVYVSNNKKSLAIVYNEFIDKTRLNHTYDYLVFMHADVSIDLNKFVSDIINFGDNYDAMGLCGCAKLSVSETPLNWFCGSRQFPLDRWGCVTHGQIGNSTSFWNSHHPTVSHHRVACVDGLCLILSRSILENTDLRFDPQFDFNCYDTDFSFQVVIKYKMRLGVLVEKSLNHYSIGEQISTKKFAELELKLRQKWDLPIPQQNGRTNT